MDFVPLPLIESKTKDKINHARSGDQNFVLCIFSE